MQLQQSIACITGECILTVHTRRARMFACTLFASVSTLHEEMR